MKTLHVLVGLPRSGKSTKARELGFPTVEPDAIRRVLYDKPFDGKNEMLVWGLAKTMVESLFSAGHNDVILDAVNHTRERRSVWSSDRWAVKFIVLPALKEECIHRAVRDGREYLIPVIERMAANFEPIEGLDC